MQEALIAMAAKTSARLELPPPIYVDTKQPRPNVKFIECDCGSTSVCRKRQAERHLHAYDLPIHKRRSYPAPMSLGS